MNILKLGTSHRETGTNCQDATGQYLDLKVVCDGCSEGRNSEVGAKLFCHLIVERYKNIKTRGKMYIKIPAMIISVMDELINIVGDDPQTIKDYLSFTVILAHGNTVYYCGDGYIIKKMDETIMFQKLDCGEYPQYLAYNYIDSNSMKKYKDGVDIQKVELNEFDNIGVASDGIRFIADREDGDPLKEEFKNLILSGKDIKMRLFFNRNSKIFQDDFSIVF